MAQWKFQKSRYFFKKGAKVFAANNKALKLVWVDVLCMHETLRERQIVGHNGNILKLDVKSKVEQITSDVVMN